MLPSSIQLPASHLFLSIFFLLVNRFLTIYTLFPYTTLFRSCSRTLPATCTSSSPITACGRTPSSPRMHTARRSRTRSEEHTSELQSRRDLVCRLLLEKKKRCANDTLVLYH